MGAFPPLDPIILGHNQFFGVDHLSAEKGALRDMHFSDPRNVVKAIEHSMNAGVDALMMSTHPRAEAICEALKSSPAMRERLHLYPLLPYIAKYVREANEKGLTNMILDALSGASTMQKIGMIWKGGAGLLTRDVFKMIELLTDMELLIFKGLKIRAVFLHQALTDLSLGLDLKDVFHFYHEYIPKTFGAEAAYCTYNLPLLVDRLKAYGISDPLIMAPFNKRGFQMHPSLAANEATMKAGGFRLAAMGTLAGGFLKPAEAYEYLFSLPCVSSVVAGASTEEHIRETFSTIATYQKRAS